MIGGQACDDERRNGTRVQNGRRRLGSIMVSSPPRQKTFLDRGISRSYDEYEGAVL